MILFTELILIGKKTKIFKENRKKTIWTYFINRYENIYISLRY